MTATPVAWACWVDARRARLAATPWGAAPAGSTAPAFPPLPGAAAGAPRRARARARTHASRAPLRSFLRHFTSARVLLHALAPAYRRRPPVSVSLTHSSSTASGPWWDLEPGEPSVHRAVMCCAVLAAGGGGAGRATATRQPTRDLVTLSLVRSFVRSYYG